MPDDWLAELESSTWIQSTSSPVTTRALCLSLVNQVLTTTDPECVAIRSQLLQPFIQHGTLLPLSTVSLTVGRGVPFRLFSAAQAMCFCVSRTLPKKNLSLTRIHERLLAIRLTLYLSHALGGQPGRHHANGDLDRGYLARDH